MKIRIDVVNRKEGEAIRRALEDKEVRAFVLLMGTLLPLPSDRARRRVLNFVEDHAKEQSQLFRQRYQEGR